MLYGNANTMSSGVQNTDSEYYGAKLANRFEISFGNYVNGGVSRYWKVMSKSTTSI